MGNGQNMAKRHLACATRAILMVIALFAAGSQLRANQEAIRPDQSGSATNRGRLEPDRHHSGLRHRRRDLQLPLDGHVPPGRKLPG